MDPFGYYPHHQNHIYGQPYQQYPPQRKNSELIRDAQSNLSSMPQKEAEDLRDFINKNSDNIRTYDLTEENLKWLKHLRKYSFSIFNLIE
jgi:hypothetical protein